MPPAIIDGVTGPHACADDNTLPEWLICNCVGDGVLCLPVKQSENTEATSWIFLVQSAAVRPRGGSVTITRMGDELVDMGHNVLVGARSLASLREGASGWRARVAAP